MCIMYDEEIIIDFQKIISTIKNMKIFNALIQILG